ncbi:MAG: hypothetical protein AAB821_00745 [Patescibacteria group bacterium]
MDLFDAYLLAVKNLLFETFARTPVVLWYILPPFLGWLAWKNWMLYVQAYYINNLEWFLLEVRIPREVTKPPQAMEVLLTIMNQTKDGTFYDRWWEGFVRFWFSLEVVSFGGEIHFYIRTPKQFRNVVESQIYSQFSQAEVSEVPDYTLSLSFDQPGSDWDMWGANFKLDKPDHFPIKTYVDYGLDKEMEEENKVDPLTPVLELLGSITPGEQIWIQIPIIASRARFHKPGTLFKKIDWKDAAKTELDKLQKRDVQTKEGEFNMGKFSQTPIEKLTADAIARSLTKVGFDCGYRVIYLAKKDKINGGIIGGIIGTTKQYNSPHLNSFKLDKKVGFEYPWQDITGRRTEKIKHELFDAYRKRSYFFTPYKEDHPFVLTTEELATIFRFPGLVAATPTLGRIESKRAEPPSNLPI